MVDLWWSCVSWSWLLGVWLLFCCSKKRPPVSGPGPGKPIVPVFLTFSKTPGSGIGGSGGSGHPGTFTYSDGAKGKDSLQLVSVCDSANPFADHRTQVTGVTTNTQLHTDPSPLPPLAYQDRGLKSITCELDPPSDAFKSVIHTENPRILIARKSHLCALPKPTSSHRPSPI